MQYQKHAEEAKLDVPKVPVLFMCVFLIVWVFTGSRVYLFLDARKPETALGDPFPAPTIIPKFTLAHDSADYESELAIVIGKTAKNVSEADALSYVLGYTASNDVSSRFSQFEQSQWCFSKSFDGACPIGEFISNDGWSANSRGRNAYQGLRLYPQN